MKRRENRVAATYKPLTASERSILRMRGNKRRASIQRGVVRVHFVKLVAADAPRVWPAVAEPFNPDIHTVETHSGVDENGHVWATAQRVDKPGRYYSDYERPQEWECANDHLCRCPRCRPQPPDAPEPEPEAPHCFVFDCPENAFYLTDGIAHCWQHRGKAEREAEADRQKEEKPGRYYSDYERPADWTRCAGDGAAWCANPDCKRTFFRNKETDTLCPQCWQKSISPPSPPWPGGAA